MAHASPVGPAPITSTSQRISGRGLVLVCGRVSAMNSVVRKSGMNHHVCARDTEAFARTTGNGDSSMRHRGAPRRELEASDDSVQPRALLSLSPVPLSLL